MIRYLAILVLCIAGCATPSLPPLPPNYDATAMRRLAQVEVPFTGPVQPSPGLWITWSCETGYVAFVEMMTFDQPDQWIRVASNIECASNAAWQTERPAIYRTGIQ